MPHLLITDRWQTVCPIHKRGGRIQKERLGANRPNVRGICEFTQCFVTADPEMACPDSMKPAADVPMEAIDMFRMETKVELLLAQAGVSRVNAWFL